MAKDPAFLFYPSDFLTGVAGLTMEERGQYITLLCLQHQNGALSDKTIRLTVGSVSVDVLKKFNQNEHGNYTNKRLELEIEKRMQFVDSRRVNGSKGGRPLKPTAEPLAKPNGYPTENLIRDENINSNNNNIKSEKIIEEMIVLKMMEIWMKQNPHYQSEKEEDYHALLQIAYKIASVKGYARHEVTNGKLEACTESWRKIVDFIKTDNFYRKLAIPGILKQWSGLTTTMIAAANPLEQKSNTPDPTKVKIKLS